MSATSSRLWGFACNLYGGAAISRPWFIPGTVMGAKAQTCRKADDEPGPPLKRNITGRSRGPPSRMYEAEKMYAVSPASLSRIGVRPVLTVYAMFLPSMAAVSFFSPFSGQSSLAVAFTAAVPEGFIPSPDASDGATTAHNSSTRSARNGFDSECIGTPPFRRGERPVIYEGVTIMSLHC